MAVRDADSKEPGRTTPLDLMKSMEEPDAPDTELEEPETPEGDAPEGEAPEDAGARAEGEGPTGDDPDGQADPDAPLDAHGQATGTAPAAVAAEDDFEPLTFRSGGRTYEIAGAVRAKDGLYIPTERADAVLQAIQRGVHHDTVWQQQLAEKDAEIARLTVDYNEEVVAATTLLAGLNEHLKSPEAAQAFLDNFAHHRALLESKVDAAKERSKREFMEKHGAAFRTAPAATEEGSAEWGKQATQALFTFADDMVERGEFRGMFSAEEQKELGVYLGRHARSYLTKADKDYPEDGIRAGQTAINLQALGADIREYAQRLGRGKVAVTAREKAQKFNAAARRAPQGRQIPAASTPQRGPRPTGPKNKKEWMAGLQRFVAAETGAPE